LTDLVIFRRGVIERPALGWLGVTGINMVSDEVVEARLFGIDGKGLPVAKKQIQDLPNLMW